MAELKTTEKMEENRMYYGQEKAESTDAVLTKCGVENQVYHLTKYKREVEKYGILNEICKVSFLLIFCVSIIMTILICSILLPNCGKMSRTNRKMQKMQKRH